LCEPRAPPDWTDSIKRSLTKLKANYTCPPHIEAVTN
jgi:hypothetical protein